MQYVLITPAYNEERYIELTIRAVAEQTIKPVKWIIVSDGSTDRTDDIVRHYSRTLGFLELSRRPKNGQHDFASKVRAFNQGVRLLDGIRFDFIGNLDADVSFAQSYFADLLSRFQECPSLGICGGAIYEERRGSFSARAGNTANDVAGAVQMFQRKCYEDVGGFLQLRYGGEDWCAQMTARMKGWRVCTIQELHVFHHGRDRGSLLNRRYRQGMMDFQMGSHPLFEMLRIVARLRERPALLGSIVRLLGFSRGYFKHEERLVSEEFVRFLRRYEAQKVPGLHRILGRRGALVQTVPQG